jgi:arginase
MFQPTFIKAVIGEGAQVIECKQGPQALHDFIIKTDSLETIQWGSVITSREELLEGGKLALVSDFMPRLSTAVLELASSGAFPIVLGGDHSCAIGTWSGIATHYKNQGDIGLIWIDAHLDSHTPETSGSGAPHGMPLASLLGYGPTTMTDIEGWCHKIKPQNVVVIGARSSEIGEERLLQRLGVQVIDIHEVELRGFEACLRDAIELVSEHTVGYGITFDIDALDPQEAPGVGSPEENGLLLKDVVDAFQALNPKLIGFELVEYNPERDDEQQTTAAACLALLNAILK